MGNTQSSSRDDPAAGQTGQGQHAANGDTLTTTRGTSTHYQSARDGLSRVPFRQTATRSRTSLYGSFRRRYSSRAAPIHSEAVQARPFEGAADEREEIPLVQVGDFTIQDDAATDIARESLHRTQSTMSRLGSRFLPDSVARGLLSSGEETAAEGRALRLGASERPSLSVLERQTSLENGSRFSLTDSIRRRIDSRNDSRLDSRRHTIRGLFPLGHTHHQLLSTENANSLDLERHEIPSDDAPEASTPFQGLSRLRRVRNSLSAPFASLFSQSQSSSSHHHSRPSPNRPSRVAFADDSDHLLPPLTSMDHRLDIDDAPHELDAVEPEARNLLSGPRVTSGMSTIRRFPHGLRSRSTRLIRRGEHPPLSQVLQLAAAAIAAQLSGHATGGAGPGRPLGGDAFDGSIQNFVQTLQDAASAQAGENIDVNAADGDLPPVNFMRVFQFPNDENGSPIASQAQSRDVDQMDIDQIAGPGDSDRSVTLVLVGVRSMPNGQDSTNSENGTLGPSLDTLLSLPFLPPANVLRNGSSGALFRRSDGRSRANARRHSMTNFSFPAQYETQRHQRTRTPASRSSTEQPFLTTPGTMNAPTPISESPPGPHPPPSTPADMRSGEATPIRRPSSASAVHSPALPDLEEDRAHQSPTPSSDTGFSVARQRRRSDSEFARRPELGSGAARRNGMVEPDHPPAGVGRSWLIYVVGTNVSPDHPAFTMPSLFTDNPSYEDMQMLSTLLGPVKPPVATQADITSAGGLFRLLLQGTALMGRASGNASEGLISMNAGERCLICLCDYEVEEEVRQLNSCQHVFHRECIDQWLTTGRNSCPMCRAQGVGEQNSTASPAPGPAPRSETA